MPDHSKISEATLDKVIPHIHSALEHLIQAWDALRDAELLLDLEITTMELSDLAGGIDSFHDVKRLVTRGHISEWLAEVQRNAK